MEDLDFADDLAIVSTKQSHLQQKSNILSEFAKQMSLNINIKQTHAMYINTPEEAPITIDGEALELVKDFTDLGSFIGSGNGANKDIQVRLNKARG